jgi:hypothetical protein
MAWADAEVTSGIAFFLGRPRPAMGKIMLTSAGYTFRLNGIWLFGGGFD